MPVLLLPEQGVGDGPGGVVNGSHQAQIGTPALQPVMAAPVYLEQHPLLGIALPAVPVLATSAPFRADHTRTGENPPHRRPAYHQPLPLRQQFLQVVVVQPAIRPLGKGQYSLPGTLWDAVGR